METKDPPTQDLGGECVSWMPCIVYAPHSFLICSHFFSVWKPMELEKKTVRTLTEREKLILNIEE